MCSKILCHKLCEEWKIRRYTDSTEDLHRNKEPFADFEQDKETDYTKYDEIMEKLNLNKGEKETIECYFVLNLSTIWRRRKSAQMKYLAIAETL